MNGKRDTGNDALIRRLAVVCAVLAVILLVLAGILLVRKKKMKNAESTAAAESTAYETEAPVTVPAGNAGQKTTRAEGETYTVVIPEEYTETAAGNKETEPAAKTSAAAAETSAAVSAQTQTQKLTDLTGIAAGTEIPAEKLELSDIGRYFTASEIKEGDAVYNRINGKSYRQNDSISLSSLRYLVMPHYNFNGNIEVGELIVNQAIADDVRKAFLDLFNRKYQIEKMHLVDDYWTGNADQTDSNSIDHNNTSSFNYRVATGSSHLSQHAYGRAIDINPQQNPYVSYSSGQAKWSHGNADAYIKRDTGLPHVITHADAAYQVFSSYGFTWGGDWNTTKDYQHFEKK